MQLTHDMAEAFGDWLELDRIQRALLGARPQLSDALVPDAERPLLQIRYPGGGQLLVARAADDTTGRWIVGVPGHPAPVLHDVDSTEEVVGIVLDALEQQNSRVEEGSTTDDGG